ncbi:hypothetical protein KJ762_13400 [bacterium]|nr:hypothetical protein [bacterium]MBU1064465.1 hypothetical protein [bacterium]MBU1635486.1 hypothetical protein [bacterium]MBU1873543.1 hypothetical protein [bacterium]
MVKTADRHLKNICILIVLLMFTSGLLAFELSPKDSLRIIRPKAALIRSAIVPGWGHLYVKKPAKSLIYFSLEAYHVYQFVEYNSIYQYVKDTKNAIGIDEWNKIQVDESYNSIEEKRKEKIKEITGYQMKDATWRPREMRNKYAWWCVGFYFIGMLDAYVDAHLYYFPSNKIELTANGESKSIGMTFSWNLER